MTARQESIVSQRLTVHDDLPSNFDPANRFSPKRMHILLLTAVSLPIFAWQMGAASTWVAGLKANEFRILIVLTQSSTGLGMIVPAQRPARHMPLADFVTIFDDLDETDDIASLWKSVDSHVGMFSSFSSGLADLYVSFKYTHEVLVETSNVRSRNS